MIRFSLFGIPVEIQPFFWVVLIMLGGATRADTAQEILQIALFVMAGFISILVHELGHALTARAFGGSVHIVLQAFGGYAAYSGLRSNRWHSFLITAAGPAVQIALGACVFGIFQFVNLNANMEYFASVLIQISFVWAILNLLPVVPLDGGQMLSAALGPKRIKLTLWISIAVSVMGVIALFQYTHSIVFPMFLGMFAWQAWQALKQID
jgi:stage IV sporulation protein FB